MVEPLRAAVELPRDVVPVERIAEELERVPGAAERATLVRPVEERRATPLPRVSVLLPPARVRPLRLEAPPREAKLRELRDASRWPTWKAWLFRWIQRPLQPPTP